MSEDDKITRLYRYYRITEIEEKDQEIKRLEELTNHLLKEVHRMQKALESEEVDPNEMGEAMKQGLRLVGLEGSELWVLMNQMTDERFRQWAAYVVLHMGMNLKPSTVGSVANER